MTSVLSVYKHQIFTVIVRLHLGVHIFVNVGPQADDKDVILTQL